MRSNWDHDVYPLEGESRDGIKNNMPVNTSIPNGGQNTTGSPHIRRRFDRGIIGSVLYRSNLPGLCFCPRFTTESLLYLCAS